MADSAVDKVNVSPPAPAAGAPSAAQRPAAERVTRPSAPAAQRDMIEARRPRPDPCWPPPFHPALLGIAQIRPICIR